MTKAWAHFAGPNVTGTGRIASTGGSANVSFQLLDEASGNTVITAGGAVGGLGPVGGQGTGSSTFAGGAASKTYRVRYYAENGLTSADVGPVSSSMTYHLYFY